MDAIDLETTLNNEQLVFFTKKGDIYKLQYKDDKQARMFINGTLSDFIDAEIKKIKATDNGFTFTTTKGTINIEWELDMLETTEEILEFETMYLKGQDPCIKPNR